MNLHQIVRGAITTVNPDYTADLYHSAGYHTDEAGQQIPYYVKATIPIQIQAITGGAL